MLKTKVTRKQQLQNSKRRNDLIVISFVAMLIISASILGIVLQKNNRPEEKVEEVEVNMGIAKAFENYCSNSTSEDVASIETNKIINKKMAPIEETTETPTEVTTEAQTEVPELTYSEEDLYWLSHIIMAEVEDQEYLSKILCGSVVLNRSKDKDFRGNTIKEVVFAGEYRESIENGRIYLEPNEDSIKAAKEILTGTTGIDIPENLVYQAQFVQGSGIYETIDNEIYCYK